MYSIKLNRIQLNVTKFRLVDCVGTAVTATGSATSTLTFSSGHEILFGSLKPNNANWIDDAVEWMGEALEHIGSSAQLCQKQCVLTVADHKVLMPTDLYFINQVAINNSVSPTSSTELDTLTTKVKELKD